jgi:hypothetical protein
MRCLPATNWISRRSRLPHRGRNCPAVSVGCADLAVTAPQPGSSRQSPGPQRSLRPNARWPRMPIVIVQIGHDFFPGKYGSIIRLFGRHFSEKIEQRADRCNHQNLAGRQHQPESTAQPNHSAPESCRQKAGSLVRIGDAGPRQRSALRQHGVCDLTIPPICRSLTMRSVSARMSGAPVLAAVAGVGTDDGRVGRAQSQAYFVRMAGTSLGRPTAFIHANRRKVRRYTFVVNNAPGGAPPSDQPIPSERTAPSMPPETR